MRDKYTNVLNTYYKKFITLHIFIESTLKTETSLLLHTVNLFDFDMSIVR